MDDVRTPQARETIPPALWVIVLVALSPFPVTALIYGYGPESRMEPMLKALLEWSAVVLSFLGGVRWGLETREANPRPMRQAFSAMCAMAGWVILMARGHTADTWILAGFIAAFLIQWLFDHQTADTPSRYPLLSTSVTTAACVSLALCLERAMHA